jgi:phage tail sheath gpL-like
MAEAWFANNRTVTLWQIAQDDGAGAKATSDLVVSGTATADGTVYLYINGKRIQVAVSSGDASTAVATAIDAAVTAAVGLPVTSSVASSTVTLTTVHGGTTANEHDARFNYFQGEEFPAGISITAAAFAGGTGSPDITAVWPVIEAEQYHVIVSGNRDAATLAAVKAEMAARSDALRMQEGVAFFGARQTHAAAVSQGLAQNSGFDSILSIDESLESSPQIAAAYAGQVSAAGQSDPARPFKTLSLNGINAPALDKRFTRSERQTLLESGIATWYVDAGGVVRIERAISTFTLNALGVADTAYLQVNTALTLSYIRFSVRARFSSRYPRHKLGNDGKRYGAGQAIMTPSRARAEFVGLFLEWEELGLVEDLEQFKRDLIVERNPSDPNRLDAVLPTNLVNQLEVLAAKIQFRL